MGQAGKAIKFFVGHGKGTNSHDGRKKVGETVATFVKEVGGRLAAIAIGHFPDESEVNDKDVCSIETDVEMSEHEGFNVVEDTQELTAITLGSSDKDSPAFVGAQRLATVQCFGNNSGDNQEPEKKIPGEGAIKMKLKEASFQELAQELKDRNAWPSQLFDEEDLKNDRKFGKILTEKESLQKSFDDFKKATEDKEKEFGTALRERDVATAKTRLEPFLEGATDLQKKFINTEFDPEKMEKIDDESIKAFVATTKEKFASLAKAGIIGDGKEPSGETSGGKPAEKTDSEDPVESLLSESL